MWHNKKMMVETQPQKELSGYVTGRFLVAMPHMQDPRFERAVIYMCGHDANGAMGIMINKSLGDLTLKGLLEYINLPIDSIKRDLPIYLGGPVDTGRGFVLHSDEFAHASTVPLSDHVALTATVDVLQSVAKGEGPKDCLLAMGYVGWGAGQLDHELHGSEWLQTESDYEILFHVPIETKWNRAIEKLGVSPEFLSGDLGQA